MPHSKPSRVSTSRDAVAADLATYGEDVIAARIAGMPQPAYDLIEERAFGYACQGMYLAKAVSLAAVEVVEGSPRPLRRSRRKFPQPERVA